MKYLQRLFILFLISAAVFSCQKEYSVENGGGLSSSTSQWSFTQGSAQYKGSIDTVGVDSSSLGGYKILTINGHSSDNKDEITLEMLGTSLKAGTYKTPYCLFAYMRSGVLIYETNQLAIDSFTIVLTKFDSTGVAGTFSGSAWDSTKTYKTIVDGKFSYVAKTITPVPPVTTDSGSLVVWSKAGCGGGTSTTPISVTVGSKSGQITKFVSTAPTNCDSTGGFYIKLPVGTYPLVAKCGTDSITGSVTIQKNGCNTVQVDFSTPVVVTDYFPTTKSSSWSYLYEASTADDTLFTLSTGQTGTINGSVPYYLFTDTDGKSKDSSFYRKANNYYYAYSPAVSDSSMGGTNVGAFEYSFLNDTLPVNSTWANGPFPATISGTTASLYVTNTILERGASATINGKLFTNIIKVKTVYSVKVATLSNTIYIEEQWFSKGVGLVKLTEYFTAPFTTPDDVLDITRYNVN